MYIHREGKNYVIIATVILVLLTPLFYLLQQKYPIIAVVLWTALFILYLWVWWFFRMPKRNFGYDPNAIFAPADGKVVVIEDTMENEYFKEEMLQISIFMSPLNVHVNRSPMEAKVSYVQYHPGKYLVAWDPKSSTENERTTLALENKEKKMLLRQVAGAVARRIVCYPKAGNHILQNEEFGFIKFGSRVDVYLPKNVRLNVNLDEKTKGGQTILAYWH